MTYTIFDLTGKKLTSYEGELDESSNTRSYLLCPPHVIHAELPAGMLEDEVMLLDGVVAVDPALVATKLAKAKSQAIQDLYDAMNADVINQMVVVFGTSNTASAQATKDTWNLMILKPQLFEGKLGLTDVAAVITYASAKIAAVETYAVYRMERIAQFQADKAAV
jgi:hypothetical protein